MSDTAESLARELAEDNCPENEVWCAFCGAVVYWEEEGKNDHAADCLWRRACELFGLSHEYGAREDG